MAKNRVKVIALGGVGEVGKNMLVLEHKDDIIIIDAGLKFPEEEMIGIDFIIPDISYLLDKKERIRGIVLTHGHEDHIGALPYILPELGVPVYATRLTRGLLTVKLKERGLLRHAQINPVEPGETLSLGAFDVEFFRVNHSIPDAMGLIIRTSAGTIVHSGDFKFDKSPADSLPTDFAHLAQVGQEGVLALLCDCVRVELPGYTPSEQVVSDSFDAVLAQARGRVIVTTFASNISRIQLAICTAHRHGRKVAIVGRSLESNVGVAAELGFLNVPDGTIISLGETRSLPHNEVMFVTTGSQGEPTSALSRIANNEHRQIHIVPGDTVILSATPVPGNEETVARTIDNLFRLGADVIYDAVMTVHVSGHASREELKLMLSIVKPQFCIPLHGEYRHMVLFRSAAQEIGMSEDNIILAEVGDMVEFARDYGRITRRVPASAILVDGAMVGELAQATLRDRQRLSRDGVVIVVVTLDRETGWLLAGPEIVTRGFVHMHGADDLTEKARDRVRTVLETLEQPQTGNGFIAGKVKDALGKFIYDRTRRRPMILPVVTEV
ncbi:MAG: ribonuclease J [Chloroflexi bacterium]|nr:ribonuclease J [Chloroflexota bacterium]